MAIGENPVWEAIRFVGIVSGLAGLLTYFILSLVWNKVKSGIIKRLEKRLRGAK